MQVAEKTAEETTNGEQAQAESLAALAAQVLPEGSQEGQQAGGVSGGVAIGGAISEAQDVIEFAANLFFPLFPSLVQVYPKEVRENLAEVSAPLMEKYGITLGELFKKWGAEIRFGMVALPLASATVKAVKYDNMQRKLAEQEAKAAKEKEAKANADR
jgi:hypothetical protein